MIQSKKLLPSVLVVLTLSVGISFAIGCSPSSLKSFSLFRASSGEDISFSDADAGSASLTVWHESFEDAQAASRESGKPILAEFTGSDWCSWCIKLKKDVLETSKFKSWARDNVVLLELDYPKQGIQSPEIRKQNESLKKRYNVAGYPSVLFLDAEGEVLGKLGYKKTPEEWIANAETQLR